MLNEPDVKVIATPPDCVNNAIVVEGMTQPESENETVSVPTKFVADATIVNELTVVLLIIIPVIVGIGIGIETVETAVKGVVVILFKTATLKYCVHGDEFANEPETVNVLALCVEPKPEEADVVEVEYKVDVGLPPDVVGVKVIVYALVLGL